MTHPEAVAKAIALLAASYAAWRPTEDTIEAWTLALGDLEPARIFKAAIQHVRVSRFPPTVAELREHAENREGIPTPYEAWENMRRKWLSRSTEPWCHPAAQRATEQMGGFQEMSANWMVDDMPANRARWVAAYESSLAAGAARHEGQQSQALAGYAFPELTAGIGDMPALHHDSSTPPG